jgi:xylan 1,4-beta-xylosidase
LGRPQQLTKQQVEQIKKQNDGSPVAKEIITIKDGAAFSKELEIRENDVFFLNMIKL